ncbi:MAG TPA: hypothetical protein P5279_07525 [Anaerohalosphaeraceae bacterium]|jgi:hypothetical protein|nr:hypothetical protein [Anaerohalosphaeraceae bacterium]HRT50326.1 hypothetical protein [Anaerohalosphaeraceae bacterium]HRT86256.1 hypothetical protein [Anaerohalosphaeraceae bacterium]
METISASVRVRYGDEAGWHDAELVVRPGLLTIVGPYGGRGMRFVPVAGRCCCKDLRNWARAAFGRPVLCCESAVVVR